MPISVIWLHCIISWLYIVEIISGECQNLVDGWGEGGRALNGGRSGAAGESSSERRCSEVSLPFFVAKLLESV